jgi:hypothetical protein
LRELANSVMSSAGSSASLLPPAADEVEISIFGPGVGECIVAHVGGGSWIVVDSCRDPESRKPAALAYFEKIGVNAATAIQMIVASHWHDDHIRGLGDLFCAASSAEFACSAALRPDEFLQLVSSLHERAFLPSTGVDEFAQILTELKRRKSGVRIEGRGPTWAGVDRVLLFRPASSTVPAFQLHGLSPTDACITLAAAEIAQQLPRAGVPKRRAVSRRPNHTAVALWLRFGSVEVLLGSDLETSTDAETGWSGVHRSQIPVGRAQIYKVAHHGSKNGHDDVAWATL